MEKTGYINLDTNASLGTDPALWSYLEAVLKDCLNPSSVHQAGQKAKYLIEEAREDLRNLLNAKDARIIFTSGASESNNLILNSIFGEREKLKSSHLIISAVEHISMLEPAKKLESAGLNLSLIYPPKKSPYRTEDFISEIINETRMISLMLANNETGDLMPVVEVANEAKRIRPDIFVFSDAVQVPGKVEFNFAQSGLDAISLSGHKVGALTGTGALIVKDDSLIQPLILGGPQELRFRAGTENLPGIVSFGYMARKLKKDCEERIARLAKIKEEMKRELFNRIPFLNQNSFSEKTLPNTLNIHIPGVRSDDLVVALDLQGILISSASACASGKPLPSHVLLSYGLTEAEAKESIRISFSENLNAVDLKRAVDAITSSVNHMRETISSEAETVHA